MPQATSRREQRRQLHQDLSRTQLLDAAEEVFGAKGFHETTLKEIAELAEFSVGSVYSFFENKDDLFLNVFLRRGEEFLLASSYGPVYGLLSQNGRRLYVVDTINARDYSFDLTTGPAGSRRPTTAAERRVGQQRIAEQIAEIAAFFDFDPER